MHAGAGLLQMGMQALKSRAYLGRIRQRRQGKSYSFTTLILPQSWGVSSASLGTSAVMPVALLLQ